MNNKEEEFFKKLLATFKIEAEDHIKIISSGLIELEKEQSQEKQDKIIESIFREAHSLKGAARAVNLNVFETMCQSFETIFNALKHREILVTSNMLEALHQSMGYLTKLLTTSLTRQINSKVHHEDEQLKVLYNTLHSFLNTGGQTQKKTQQKIKSPESSTTVKQGANFSDQSVRKMQPQKSLTQDKSVTAEIIRVSAKKMDSLLLQAEELLSVKLAMNQQITNLQTVRNTLNDWKKERTKIFNDIRTLERGSRQTVNDGGINIKKNKSVEKLIEYLNWNDTYLKTLERELVSLIKNAKLNHHSFGIMTDSLLDDIKKAMMLPISSVLEILPKIVRDLSKDQNKEVELIIHGAEIEIDKRILDELKDPLIHMVRNCIDHGIEKPEVRKKKHKSQRGEIKIEVAQKVGSKVEILVSDDGAGVDYKKVCESVQKLELISNEEFKKMGNEQILSFIFQSGVSSSSLITDISGRGLGLAIVREKIEKLGGTVSVETRTDGGTTFRIILPLTISTVRGIFVRLDEQTFVIPISYVEQTIRIKKEEVKTVENRETIQLNGEVISLVKLFDVLGLVKKGSNGNEQSKNLLLVIMNHADKKIAFLVDEILGEQEVLIKTPGKQLSQVKNISGVTIVADGKVVPVLNIFDLMKSSVQEISPVRAVDTMLKETTKKKSVLVVEDSITSRTLLKNIIELAGYDVSTAVDGVDAFTQIRTKDFDIVVSDVDMPRMSGFDLTLKIRSDKKFADLPVVLVTALESREDREHGINVGANAYIVKSRFDQSNLLEVIRQLI